jgi:hypothetical protein
MEGSGRVWKGSAKFENVGFGFDDVKNGEKLEKTRCRGLG